MSPGKGVSAPEEIPFHRTPEAGQIARGRVDGTGFVSAMNHAMGTSRIIPAAVAGPIRILHQLPVRCAVPVGNQVAGSLPALGIPSHRAPGTA